MRSQTVRRLSAPSCAAAFVLTLAPAAATAQDARVTDTATADDPVAAAFVELEDEYDEAYSEYRRAASEASKAYRKARESDPSAKYEGPRPIDPDFYPRFDRLASAGSHGAKVWCLMHYHPALTNEAKSRDFTRRALEVMTLPDADLSPLPRVIAGKNGRLLEETQCHDLLGVLETIAPTKAVAAEAAYTSASMLAPYRGGTEEQVAAQLAAYRNVTSKYPDTKSGKRAGGQVFKAENLQIGMIAPDIVGKDVDGNAMKLSDFRGKVTVIDFWGFW